MGTETNTMKMQMRPADRDAIREAEALVETKRRELYDARRRLAEAHQNAAAHTLVEVSR